MGIFIALTVFLCWAAHLLYTFFYVEIDFTSPITYLHLLLQTYFFTGLFITAHDSMHGAISKNRKVNNTIGKVSTMAYAFLSYKTLSKKHYLHHQFPATEKDPDFSPNNNNFFIWWFVFMKNYITWWQLLFMAISFNVLLIWFSELKLLMFWVFPAVLSTFQLFYFGTYLPHRKPFNDEMKPHKSRSQKRNHLWAMLSCYFFGYHWEHHESPTTPWWKLHKIKR